MEFESVLISAALALAVLPLLMVALASWKNAALAALLVFGVALPVVTLARQEYLSPTAIDPDVIDRPTVAPHDDYVSSSRCRSCHPAEYASWDQSYHQSMTQEAVAGVVVGNFDDVTLAAGDWSYRLERRGGEFWVITERPEDPHSEDAGPRVVEKPVVLTTGSHNYQVYWLPDTQKGVLRAFPFVFLIDEQKWIPRKAAFLSPPTGPRHEEKARWNNGCAKCHSLDAKWRPVRPKTDTQTAELGISCEACHGPGQEHVRVNRDPSRRYAQHWADDGDPSIVQPERVDARRASEICGQCHAISRFPNRDDFTQWAHNGYAFRPGDVLGETRAIVRGTMHRNSPQMQSHLAKIPNFLEDSFWPDGVVRIAGREYNGLLETPCYQRGEMSCLSCHSMHQQADDPRPVSEWADDQLKPGMRGNLACIQCHERFESEQSLTAHTHHAPGSSGSECQNCHMPYTTYGLLKAIRSHTIDNPSVTESAASGRPNACNQCHLDKTLAWAAEHLETDYGIAQPVLSEPERTVAASLLWLLRGHAGQRALAAWTMGWEPARQIGGGDWLAPYLGQLLVDPYDAVRLVAHRALRRQPGFEDFAYDALGEPAQRMQTSRRAIAIWSRIGRNENLTTGDNVLINRSGELDLPRINELLSRRDDRQVTFRE
jgi:hypothetical protein